MHNNLPRVRVGVGVVAGVGGGGGGGEGGGEGGGGEGGGVAMAAPDGEVAFGIGLALISTVR